MHAAWKQVATQINQDDLKTTILLADSAQIKAGQILTVQLDLTGYDESESATLNELADFKIDLLKTDATAVTHSLGIGGNTLCASTTTTCNFIFPIPADGVYKLQIYLAAAALAADSYHQAFYYEVRLYDPEGSTPSTPTHTYKAIDIMRENQFIFFLNIDSGATAPEAVPIITVSNIAANEADVDILMMDITTTFQDLLKAGPSALTNPPTIVQTGGTSSWVVTDTFATTVKIVVQITFTNPATVFGSNILTLAYSTSELGEPTCFYNSEWERVPILFNC